MVWIGRTPPTSGSDASGQGRAVRDMQRGPDHPEGEKESRLVLDQPWQVLTRSLMKYHREVSSDAQTSEMI